MSFCPFCNRMHCDHVLKKFFPPGEKKASGKESSPPKEKKIKHISVPVMDLGFRQ